MTNIDDWNLKLAEQLSADEHITLSEQHLEIIMLMRNFYHTYKLHPSMRAFIKFLKEHIHGKEEIDSLYIYVKFPDGLKQIAKIAGLPKPPHCL